MSWPTKLSFVRGIVSGMKYLHSLEPSVIHSDLNTRNVLVSDQLVAKVSHHYNVLRSVSCYVIIRGYLYSKIGQQFVLGKSFAQSYLTATQSPPVR